MKLIDAWIVFFLLSIIAFSITSFCILLRKVVITAYVVRRYTGWALFLRWGVMSILMAAGIFIAIWATYAGFHRIEVGKQSVVLGFCWPRSSVIVPIDDGIRYELRKTGNGKRAYLRIYCDGKCYDSTTMQKDVGNAAFKYLENGLVLANGHLQVRATLAHVRGKGQGARR